MNSSASASVEVAAGMASELGSIDTVDMAICPPFVYIPGVVEAFKGSNIGVGAQNMYFEDNGAFTGEISGQMLKDIGCRYVILGHSERRHVLGETDQLINTKVKKALADELEIMFCVGELLDQRKSGTTAEVVAMRVRVDDSVYGVRLRQVLLGKIPGITHRAVYQSHVIEHVAGLGAEDGDIGYFVAAQLVHTVNNLVQTLCLIVHYRLTEDGRIDRIGVIFGALALQEIVEYFGKQVLQEDGTLDRKAVSDIVFRDFEKRKKLEGFTHPRIHEECEKQVNELSLL